MQLMLNNTTIISNLFFFLISVFFNFKLNLENIVSRIKQSVVLIGLHNNDSTVQVIQGTNFVIVFRVIDNTCKQYIMLKHFMHDIVCSIRIVFIDVNTVRLHTWLHFVYCYPFIFNTPYFGVFKVFTKKKLPQSLTQSNWGPRGNIGPGTRDCPSIQFQYVKFGAGFLIK